MKRSEISALPGGAERRTFLYAVARTDGAIKIGCSRSPRARIGGLFDAMRRVGLSMTGAYVVETRRHQFAAERDALGLMAGKGVVLPGTREWFTGARPAEVVAVLHVATGTPQVAA